LQTSQNTMDSDTHSKHTYQQQDQLETRHRGLSCQGSQDDPEYSLSD